MNGLKKRRKNGQNCAFESVSHVIGTYYVTRLTDSWLIDKWEIGRLQWTPKLLGVSLVVLWHFDETILG